MGDYYIFGSGPWRGFWSAHEWVRVVKVAGHDAVEQNPGAFMLFDKRCFYSYFLVQHIRIYTGLLIEVASSRRAAVQVHHC